MRFFSGTVVVLGSGPSLVPEDIEATKHLPTIAVNTTWEKARHCAVIFAGDHRWWVDHAENIDIAAHRVSLSYNSELLYKTERFRSKAAKDAGFNSGAVAIEYAIINGASRVLLLGMDCSVVNGEHHHGKHARSPNPTAQKCAIWKPQFLRVRNLYPDAEIINCSRYTELDMFSKATLQEVLCGHGLTCDSHHQSAAHYIALA